MPDIKISQLSNLTFLDSTDVIVVNDASSGTTKKASLSTLLDLVSARLVSDSDGGVSVIGDLTVDNEIIAGGDITAETGTIGFGSLKDITENITITKFVDAIDGIAANNNDTTIPTSAAVKAYADVSGGGFDASGTLLTDSANGIATPLFPIMIGNIGTTDSALVDSDLAWTAATQVLSVRGNIVPAEDSVWDLGTPTQKWRDLYLSGSTLSIGPDGSALRLRKDGTNLSIEADAVVATAFIGDGSGLSGLGIPDAPRTVKLSPDTSQIIRYDSDGVTENDSLVFTALTENFTGVQSYKFYVDGIEKSTVSVDAGTAQYTLADGDEPAYDQNVLIRVDALEGGVVKASDYVSVYGIKASIDGQTTTTVFLTNEVHAEAADQTGLLTGNLDDAGGFMKVFVGLTDVTGDGALTYSVASETGIDATIASSGEYTINSFDSLVTQNGVAQLQVVIPNSLIPGYSGADVTIQKQYSIVKQIGGSGTNGVDARAVKCIPLNGQVIRYDSANQEFDTLQFEAVGEGTTGVVTYQWSIKDADEAESEYATASRSVVQPLQNSGSTTFTLPDGQEPNFGVGADQSAVRTLQCAMYEDGVLKARDIVSLYAVTSGYGVLGFLTNGQHVEPCDSDGAPITALTDGNGQFKVLIGTQEVQDDANVTFAVTANEGINVTIGGDGQYVLGSFTDNTLSVLKGTANLRATVGASLFPDTQNDVEIDLQYSVAKSPRGPKGNDGTGGGDPGLDSRSVILEPDNGQVVRYNDAGTEDPAVVMSFNATPENTTGTVTYQFLTKLIGAGGNYVEAQAAGTSTAFTLDGTTNKVKPAANQQIAIKVNMYEDAVLKASDYITVYGLVDGTTLTGFLTNEAHIEPFNAANTAPKDGNFDTAGGTFKMFRGTTEITTSCTFAVQSETGVDVEIDGNGVYTVTSLSANRGSADFQCTIPQALIQNATSDFLYDKTYSISKSLDGETPEPVLPTVVIDLSNENHSVTGDENGVVQTPLVASNIGGSNFLTGATTTLSIFEGVTDTTANFTIAITPASDANLTYQVSGDGRTVEITDMGDATESATLTFTATRTGYSDAVTVFTITKVNAGGDGVGDPATVYSVISGASAIGANTDLDTYVPNPINFTALKYVGNAAPVTATTGTFMQVLRDGNATPVATSTNGTIAYSIPDNTATSLEVQLYLGSNSSGSLLDNETIPIITDGVSPPSTPGGRGPGRWTDSYNSTSVALPTTNSTIQAAWDATGTYNALTSDISAAADSPVFGDQYILTKNDDGGTFVAQNAYIYTTVWTQQTEFIDGSLLVAGTVTADSFATSGIQGTETDVGRTTIKDTGVEVESWNGSAFVTRVKLGDLT